MNYDYDKQMLQENTSNLQSQKNLIYEFSAIDKAATEEVKSGNFKTKKNLNLLIFGQINIYCIRNMFELLFSLVSNSD